jgi:hypothetical protein
MVTALVLALSLVCAAAVSAEELRVPLPDRGGVVLSVPEGWTAQVQRSRSDLPPTIRLTPTTGGQFEVLITPLWSATSALSQPSREALRGFIGRAVQAARPRAVEPELPIVDLAGPGIVGAYFSATDRQPEPDGYKHMTQGILALADLRVTFTVLANGDATPIAEKALDMLRTMRRTASADRRIVPA